VERPESGIYGAITINDLDDFVSPFRSAQFPCLIWDHDGNFTNAERSAIAGALYEAGYRWQLVQWLVYGWRSNTAMKQTACYHGLMEEHNTA